MYTHVIYLVCDYASECASVLPEFLYVCAHVNIGFRVCVCVYVCMVCLYVCT